MLISNVVKCINMKTYFFVINNSHHEVQSLEELETAYFSLLREKKTAKGVVIDEDGEKKIIWDIVDGVEQTYHRRVMFTSYPIEWEAPEPETIRGLFNQFTNLSELTKSMNLGTNTITTWKSKGHISYYRWRFLLELLDLISPIDKNKFHLKESKII